MGGLFLIQLITISWIRSSSSARLDLPPLPQALIVADAYKQCIWTDWVNPLYRKVVVGGDFRYLHNFKSAFPLTPTLFQQLASK